ncbi:hypothetical protein LCGC14_1299530 [marine sediment metagenome]|uniref:Uncharacterized protein n=1 Tax=marine sediment metagenome TaxID=412755 RepID=A0A0F9NSY9_9ZZZZ
MNKLEPLLLYCSCKVRATHALEILLGNGIKASIPLCPEHCKNLKLKVELGGLPTYKDVLNVEIVEWPPKKGEICEEPFSVGCPKCESITTLEPKAFSVTVEGLKPSFICPHCEFHGWMRS